MQDLSNIEFNNQKCIEVQILQEHNTNVQLSNEMVSVCLSVCLSVHHVAFLIISAYLPMNFVSVIAQTSGIYTFVIINF